MIIVDTSVWASYFTGRDSREAHRLDEALRGEEDVAIVSDSLVPLLGGFRPGTALKNLERALLRLPIVTPSLATRAAAAALLRALRTRRVAIRDALSCVVAQTCIEMDAELLTASAELKAIARHSRLHLCKT